MTMQIAVQEHALERVRHQVESAHDELEQGRLALGARADELLADAWRGPAARQYSRAWAEWESGARRLVAALLDLASAMGVAEGQLVAADTSAASGANRLQARLGG